MDKFGFPNENEIYNKKLPEVHDVMREMRKLADEYDAVLIGETWTQNVAQLREYYGDNNDELQMPMDLMLTQFHELAAPLFREHITRAGGCGRLAGVCDQQSRHHAFVYALGRRQA